MSATLGVRSNSLHYAASYATPAFGLWGKGGVILEGLYGAFNKFGVGLGDISSLAGQASMADESVVVKWGDRSTFTFRFDRIEASIRNYQTSDLEALPGYLVSVEGWLRAILPEHRFRAHVVQSSSHSALLDAQAEQVLGALGARDLPFKGTSRGHGVSYHYVVPERKTRVDFMLDHSLSIAGGIFTQFALIIDDDRIDYADTLDWGRQMLTGLLHEAGLAFGETE